MPAWTGQRSITVISACMTVAGLPTFAINEVAVTHEEYENGVHYSLAEGKLMEAGYEEPIVHFDLYEAPPFLIPAVKAHLSAEANGQEPVSAHPPEEP
jgi:hypothetical protein